MKHPRDIPTKSNDFSSWLDNKINRTIQFALLGLLVLIIGFVLGLVAIFQWVV